jgi:hypothetical protein
MSGCSGLFINSVVTSNFFAAILCLTGEAERVTGPELSDTKLPEKSAGIFSGNPVLRGDFNDNLS